MNIEITAMLMLIMFCFICLAAYVHYAIKHMKNENDIYMINIEKEINISFSEISRNQKIYTDQMIQNSIQSMTKEIRNRATQPLQGATVTLQNNLNQTESFTITKIGKKLNG